MGAEAAGEQAIAVRDVHLVTRSRAGGADRARHEVRPSVDVARGIADHRRLSGCPARSVDANNLAQRHREHSKRIILPEIVFGGEWKMFQIAEVFKIACRNYGLGEFLAIVRDARGTGERLLEPHELQRAEFVDTGCFNRLRSIEGRSAQRLPGHHVPPIGHTVGPAGNARNSPRRGAKGAPSPARSRNGSASRSTACDDSPPCVRLVRHMRSRRRQFRSARCDLFPKRRARADGIRPRNRGR